MGTEVSVQGFDRRGKRKAQGDIERIVRMARDNNIGRSNKGRSCSYISVGTAEAFSISRNEDTEGKECRVFGEGISGTGQEILGDAYLGEGILCKYGWDKRRNNTGIYKEAARRRRKGRTGAFTNFLSNVCAFWVNPNYKDIH